MIHAMCVWQEGGKRTATIACKTSAKIICIRREAFQQMLLDDRSDVSIHGNGKRRRSSIVQDAVSAISELGARRRIEAPPSPLQRISTKMHAISKEASSKTLHKVAANFAASERSRSDVNHPIALNGPEDTSAEMNRQQQALIQRAANARAIMEAWQSVVEALSGATATPATGNQRHRCSTLLSIPLPEKLTEAQALTPLTALYSQCMLRVLGYRAGSPSLPVAARSHALLRLACSAEGPSEIAWRKSSLCSACACGFACTCVPAHMGSLCGRPSW